MLTVYGSPLSSSGRCFWCLEETGQQYKAQSINFSEKEHKSPEYLKLNPNGKVPCLKDGDFVIWESMAINFYLAEKYKPELLGSNIQERALVRQWSIWSIAELQPPLIEIFIQKVFVPEEKRSEEVIKKATSKLPALLECLNSELATKTYLVSKNFSLADLNTASVVGICQRLDYSLTDYKHISSWLETLSERPAFKKYISLCESN